MYSLIKSYRLWLIGVLSFAAVGFALYLGSLPDGNLRLTFCDVGQGDAIYLDLPDGSDVLIDGGPNERVLQCLGNNMPFWDRRLELVVLTHPQADHLEGLIDVAERYYIDYFVASPLGNDTKGFRELASIIKEMGVQVRNVYAGYAINVKCQMSNVKECDEVAFRVLWPSREFVAERVKDVAGAHHGAPLLTGRNILGVSTVHADLNDFSIVMELKYGEFEVLLTGDADEDIQDEIMSVSVIESVEVFKIPHHGSKYGILEDYLIASKPQLAVVSVGKNRWGHPSDEVVRRLGERGIRLFRTDRDGDVTIITDGDRVWVETEN